MANQFSDLAQAQATLIEARAKFLTAAGEMELNEAKARLSDQQAILTDAARRELEQQIEMKRLTVVEYRRALDALHQEQSEIENEIRLIEERGRNLLLFNQYEGLPADLVPLAWTGAQYFLAKASEIAHWAAQQMVTDEMKTPGNWCHVRDNNDRPPPGDVRTLIRLVQWGRTSCIMPVAGSAAASLVDGLVDRLTKAAQADTAACQSHQSAISAGVASSWPAMQIMALSLPQAVQAIISGSKPADK